MKDMIPHYCKAPESAMSDGWGIAIDECYENNREEFWVTNGEYGSQVNYCPYCGAKAPVQIESPELPQ
jgi:hypothetical protein